MESPRKLLSLISIIKKHLARLSISDRVFRFVRPASIYAGDFSDAAGSDIVILTSGLPRKPGQSRLDLAQTNVDITKQIIPKVTKYATEAVYVVVSNPVDILTYVFNKVSDLPQERIIGSGTILDTARLRSRLSEYYKISQQNVHAYVFGEHGDTSFVPWSLANISSIAIDKYHDCLKSNRIIPKLEFAEVEDYIRKSGAKIIDRKGCYLLRCICIGLSYMQMPV